LISDDESGHANTCEGQVSDAMRVEAAVRSDIGRLRQRNEDAYLVKESLFIVADGMGGHRGGDVASALALETIESATPGEVTLEGLVEDIKRANQAVLERGEADRDLRGMGTTVTAILVEDGRAHVAHVGDSRAYLLRNGSLQQLTEDHTLVQRMVREGRLTEDEAANHPQRSVLTRALGVDDEIGVDELTLDVHVGDRLLLCTDGLTTMIDRGRIQKILARERDPQAACDKLIDAANRAGGDDNITVIVLDFFEDGSDSGSIPKTSSAATAARQAPAPDGDEASSSRTVEDSPTATSAVPSIQEDGHAERRPPRRRVRWRRVVLWLGVAALLIIGALIGARAYIGHQWYVGDSNGKVAIYNGIPTSILGIDLSNVKEPTDLDARQAERLQPWSGLKDGITAESLSAARRIVEQIRQDLQPGPGT
jgi:serine/threonine protein phosphatase PrpC